MTPKQHREIKIALERFKSLIYFEEALEKPKNRVFKDIDKVVVSRALMSLLEMKQEERNKNK